MDDSLVSRYNTYFTLFKQRLEKYKNITSWKANTKEKKNIVYGIASKNTYYTTKHLL